MWTPKRFPPNLWEPKIGDKVEWVSMDGMAFADRPLGIVAHVYARSIEVKWVLPPQNGYPSRIQIIWINEAELVEVPPHAEEVPDDAG